MKLKWLGLLLFIFIFHIGKAQLKATVKFDEKKGRIFISFCL